jgi:hypothetical protein
MRILLLFVFFKTSIFCFSQQETGNSVIKKVENYYKTNDEYKYISYLSFTRM